MLRVIAAAAHLRVCATGLQASRHSTGGAVSVFAASVGAGRYRMFMGPGGTAVSTSVT